MGFSIQLSWPRGMNIFFFFLNQAHKYRQGPTDEKSFKQDYHCRYIFFFFSTSSFSPAGFSSSTIFSFPVSHLYCMHTHKHTLHVHLIYIFIIAEYVVQRFRSWPFHERLHTREWIDKSKNNTKKKKIFLCVIIDKYYVYGSKIINNIKQI